MRTMRPSATAPTRQVSFSLLVSRAVERTTSGRACARTGAVVTPLSCWAWTESVTELGALFPVGTSLVTDTDETSVCLEHAVSRTAAANTYVIRLIRSLPRQYPEAPDSGDIPSASAHLTCEVRYSLARN